MNHAHGWHRIQNDAVWRHTRIIFVGSLLVFLINIVLGFLNVVSLKATGGIPRWVIVTHLHSGTLGWLTLSAIGFTVWIFTGNREVSKTYEKRVKWLAWAAVIIGAGYVLSFAIIFYPPVNEFVLLTILGTGMMLVIWATALLALTQLRKQPVLRTVHLLVAGAFTVASFGAIMGVLLSLHYAFSLPFDVGSLPLPYETPSLNFHAGPMDIYAVVIGTALVEWLVDRDKVSGWSWHGALQAGFFTLAGLLAFIPVETVSDIATVLGILIGSLIFLVRMGWRAVLTNPFRRDESTWGFFAPIWVVVFVGGIIASIAGVVPQDAEWFGPVVLHAYFIGLLTNSLFGMLSGRTRDNRTSPEWIELGTMWLINLGLLTFMATEFMMEEFYRSDGAIVMGFGVLLGVATIGYRLLGES
ncbi:MAG: hypothetical protein SV377_01865 [Halobacteria archaeon]|nr:hypothetical protein [Halobacteria archaeon]